MTRASRLCQRIGIGRDHELALALWDTGWYEARMLTAFVDEPARVTAAQMDRWARDFDNWAICRDAWQNQRTPRRDRPGRKRCAS